jgi:RING finger protein 113A
MDDAVLPPVAVFKKRSGKVNFRKRAATPPSASSSEEEYSTDDESGQRIKRRRRGGIAAGSSAVQKTKTQLDLSGTKFESSRSAAIEASNDATKGSNWYDEAAPDALSAKSLLGTTRSKPANAGVDERDGTYKGSSNYTSFIQKHPDAQERKAGPMKAPANVRTITVLDFQADTCKDYKTTGFCGFGDSCKFVHAREDYKQGWALDKEWELNTKGKAQKGTVVASAANRNGKDGAVDEEDAALLEKIPFACIICKESYKHPVVTTCGHYFCEKCALQRYKKTPTCAACSAGTAGVFNGAKNLQKLLDRKKKREERLKEEEEKEARESEDET